MGKFKFSIENLYKERFFLQDEEFSYELATKVLPEILWDYMYDAYYFLEGLFMIEKAIHKVFNQDEIQEFGLYFYVNKGKVYIYINDNLISYVTDSNKIYIDENKFSIDNEGFNSLINHFNIIKQKINED